MKGSNPQEELTTELLPGSSIDAQQWDQFVQHSPQGGLYALHGYASALEQDWQALIVHDHTGWKGVMPLLARKKWGIPYVSHPPFCQFWGPILPPLPEKPIYRQLSEAKKVLSEMAFHLAGYKKVVTYISPDFSYPLPFFWQKLELHTRYTFQLSLEPIEETLKSNCAPPLRRQIKKVTKAGLSIREEDTIHHLLHLIEQNKKAGHDLLSGVPDGYNRLTKLNHFLQKAQLGTVLTILDGEEVLASGLFGYYKGQTIYLIGSQLPSRSNSGAMSALMWEAILRAKTSGCHTFDFEGSMIEGVEAFFRKFGAMPVPYLQISKNDLPLPIRWISG